MTEIDDQPAPFCPRGCPNMDHCFASLAIPCARPTKSEPDVLAELRYEGCGHTRRAECGYCGACLSCDSCGCEDSEPIEYLSMWESSDDRC